MFDLASFTGLQLQITRWKMEGLVKLLRRMTSGERLEAWLIALCTGSATPPDVHLTSFYIGVLPHVSCDRRPGNEAMFDLCNYIISLIPGPFSFVCIKIVWG